MDENTWRFAQLMMCLIGIQTTFITIIIGFVWKNLSTRMDKIEGRMDKYEDRLTRIENDLIEIKTILRMQECCMINNEKHQKKAE